MKLVAHLVEQDEKGAIESVSTIDMRGRVLTDWEDAKKWLFHEAPKRADLSGRRIDIVDLDEPQRTRD